jgi:hypothetical protein
MALGKAAGWARYVDSLSRKRRCHFTEDMIRRHGEAYTHAFRSIKDVTGALSEIAFARHYGVPIRFDNMTDKLTGDVLHRCQIRSTFYPSGSLLVYENDPAEHAYFLILRDGERSNRFRIVGHLRGAVAREVGTWRRTLKGGRDCWWISQAKLKEPPDPQAPAIRSRLHALAKVRHASGGSGMDP